MNWIPLESIEQIDKIVARSNQVPCVIFKHSTRCSISSMAKFRLEEDWDIATNEVEPYFLDLIAHRAVSDEVAEAFSVYHESPQILLIKDGECTYESSHLDITVEELKEGLTAKW
ncbi:MAG: bacillithiol system redox-active protein YtxJ [Bacteroidota bacterium]